MDNKPENTGEIQVRNEKGQFLKGTSGNPDGKPIGSRNWSTLLEEAIEKVQKTKDDTVLEKFVKLAYMRPQVMIALVKKLVADKTFVEGGTRDDIKLTIEHVGKARETFKRKLDNISKRLKDTDEQNGKNEAELIEEIEDDPDDIIPAIPEKKILPAEETESKSDEIEVSGGMSYSKYGKVTIK